MYGIKAYVSDHWVVVVEAKLEKIGVKCLEMRGLGARFRFGLRVRTILLYYNPPSKHNSIKKLTQSFPVVGFSVLVKVIL